MTDTIKVSLGAQLAVLGALSDVHPIVRCEAGGKGTLKVSAGSDTTLVVITTKLQHSCSGTTTLSWDRARKPLQLSSGGWADAGEKVHRRRCLKPRVQPNSARSVTVDAAAAASLISAYLTAPEPGDAVFDAFGDHLAIAISGQIVRASARTNIPLTSGVPAAASVPLDLAQAAFSAVNGPATISVSDSSVRIDDGSTRIDIFSSIAAVAAPSIPDPGRRRHDVDLRVDDWANFVHSVGRSVIDIPPCSYLRVRGAGDERTLAVDVRAGHAARRADLPCSSSDHFGVDVAWPALAAMMAPVVSAGGDRVVLRAYDPNPNLTPLVATYTGAAFTGFAAIGARRPMLVAV